MCGRFALSAEPGAIIAHFNLRNAVVLKPRFNIAPSQVIPIIRIPGQIEFLVWGLKPKWLKEGQLPFVNARMETVTEKPAFKFAFKQQRCLVIANGYYEWKQIGNIKQPYFICLPEKELFAFAALWDGDTCALLTKTAEQQSIAKIHDRMPVILDPDQYSLWLDPKAAPEILQAAMLQNNLSSLQIFPVTTKVNNPKHDVAECVMPL